MNALDLKPAFPPCQLDDAIMGHSTAHVFHLRRERDHVSRLHRRQVADAKSRLVLLKFVLGLPDVSIKRKNAHATEDDYDKHGEQKQPVHGDVLRTHLRHDEKRRKPTWRRDECQLTVCAEAPDHMGKLCFGWIRKLR